MNYQWYHIPVYRLIILICILIIHPSQQTVSNGQFSAADIKMKRFSNPISISIHQEIPDLIPYQVFLQILFRLPEANAKNLAVYQEPSLKKNEGASYVIQGLRMNSFVTDSTLNLKMLNDVGIMTDETNDDENVEDFIGHYKPDFSIRYYTCESFIFELINDAFQSSENLDYLIKLHMIVTDLHNFLRFKMGGSVFLGEGTTDGPFYKAEIISRDKLHLLKQGIDKYITFQSFLSTTTDKSRSLDFINKTDVDYKKQAIVLYVIDMNYENDIQQLVQPLSDITFISCTSDEREILFSIGQVFKIRSMIQNEVTRIWTVNLEILRTNETEYLTNLTNYYLSKIIDKDIFYNGIQARVNFEPLTITTLVTIADYYSSILVKDYDKAEFYYEKFLKEELESPDDFDFAEQPAFYYNRIYNLYYLAHGHINLQLARIRYEQHKYVEASEYLEPAYDAYSKLPQSWNPKILIAQVYINTAKIRWAYYGKYAEIAEYLLHGLQMDTNSAEIFINIGLIQAAADLDSYAKDSFSTALSMIKALNETDYLSYGLIHRQLGHLYVKSNQAWLAAFEYLQAEQMYEKSVPSNHELRQQISDDIKRIVKSKDDVHEDL